MDNINYIEEIESFISDELEYWIDGQIVSYEQKDQIKESDKNVEVMIRDRFNDITISALTTHVDQYDHMMNFVIIKDGKLLLHKNIGIYKGGWD